jgi:hypothetical protein
MPSDVRLGALLSSVCLAKKKEVISRTYLTLKTGYVRGSKEGYPVGRVYLLYRQVWYLEVARGLLLGMKVPY